MRPGHLLTTLLVWGCTASPGGDGADGPVDGVDDTEPGVDTDGRPLRPNVQAGQPPEADGQTPAFPEQTRAPQPAEATAFTTSVVADGLDRPWGIALLPGGGMLVTERDGELHRIGSDGTVHPPLTGLPAIQVVGQGGLLDVALSPDFDTDRLVYVTFAEARDGGVGASVARGRLSQDGTALTDTEVVFRQQPAWSGGRHFGSRLVFDDDGHLYVTFGDRGDAFDNAQDPEDHIGTVVRIAPDGSVPEDNPFVDGGGAPEVWSYGHRNIQSATLGADGRLWTVEHGAQGGDELNRPEAGVNHGWPVISYGENYNGQPVGEGLTAQQGMAQPVYFWDPVIAPSGMATYRGDRFAGWDGDLLVGGLVARSLIRLTLRDDRVYTEEWLDVGRRVRDVEVAPDGTLLLLTDEDDGVILRLTPEG